MNCCLQLSIVSHHLKELDETLKHFCISSSMAVIGCLQAWKKKLLSTAWVNEYHSQLDDLLLVLQTFVKQYVLILMLPSLSTQLILHNNVWRSQCNKLLIDHPRYIHILPHSLTLTTAASVSRLKYFNQYFIYFYFYFWLGPILYPSPIYLDRQKVTTLRTQNVQSIGLYVRILIHLA